MGRPGLVSATVVTCFTQSLHARVDRHRLGCALLTRHDDETEHRDVPRREPSDLRCLRRHRGDAPRRGQARLAARILLALALSGPPSWAGAQDAPPAPGGPAAAPRTLEILEFRAEGASQLSEPEVEAALRPFLGPGRVLEDVEQARAALEKAYSEKGFQSVTVAIPPQTVREGVVTLQVTEGRVGRLRVVGARWFLPSDVRRLAPSVAEGTVPNFNEIVRDIYALNQQPERRVTPALRAGAVPGTMDVDLNVEDRLPLHGSLELNNRQSANTSKLRLNGALRYDNLWQAGHSLAFSFQTAPRHPADGQVFSIAYLARVPRVPWFTLGLSGMLQDSDISTLGGIAVQGKGRILGARAGFLLPGSGAFSSTASVGLDVKRFEEGLRLGPDTLKTPVTYWPVTAQYAAGWSLESSQTQLAVALVFGLRPLGSSAPEFDAKRYQASGSFVLCRGELSRTQEVVGGLQLFARLQGQFTGEPLLGSEQFMIGGAESVRGYLEGEAAGDVGPLATLEVRSPSLAAWLGRPAPDELRLLAFFDTARAAVIHPLPEVRSITLLRGTGVGLRLRLLDGITGAADVGLPLLATGTTQRLHPRFHLRLAGAF
jgi:hemolysin activation/secretion protein